GTTTEPAPRSPDTWHSAIDPRVRDLRLADEREVANREPLPLRRAPDHPDRRSVEPADLDLRPHSGDTAQLDVQEPPRPRLLHLHPVPVLVLRRSVRALHSRSGLENRGVDQPIVRLEFV